MDLICIFRNKNGTLNVQSRIHKFLVSFKLAPEATALHPAHPNLKLEYLDTLLLTGPDGEPTTGLEADANGHASYPGFPPLPAATYEGDGFGGEGPGGKRISMDTEGLALDKDGYFWVSDEYGPYIYKFDQNGKMVLALQPPSAFLPRRNGTVSFSAASPPVYDPDAMPVPEEPQSGRANNQGFEGLTLSPDGAKLHVMIQSAQNQEGGPNDPYRRPVRVLEYDISSDQPKYLHEYAVMLPTYLDKNNAEKVAAQSEIHQLPTGDFLVLARDEDCGHGQECTESMYRHADIFSITNSTTDIKGPTYDDATGAAASREGELKEGIVPAQYCQFINYNLPSQLAKFGLHNGGKQDSTLLNEKWESLALLKANPYITLPKGQNEYFLFSFSDNDYVTQDGTFPLDICLGIINFR